jgi:hypothetical protein
MEIKCSSRRVTHCAIVTFQRASPEAKILVDGSPLGKTEALQLHHFARVLFGSSNLFCFSLPAERDEAQKAGKTWKTPTYEDAQVCLEQCALCLTSAARNCRTRRPYTTPRGPVERRYSSTGVPYSLSFLLCRLSSESCESFHSPSVFDPDR